MKVLVSIDCDAAAVASEDGHRDCERGLIDILTDLVDMLKSGTKLYELNGHKCRGITGDEAAVIFVSETG